VEVKLVGGRAEAQVGVLLAHQVVQVVVPVGVHLAGDIGLVAEVAGAVVDGGVIQVIIGELVDDRPAGPLQQDLRQPGAAVGGHTFRKSNPSSPTSAARRTNSPET